MTTRRAAADRDDEFRRFVEASRATLLSAGTMLTAGDRHLAEDLVQIALTRTYLAWPRVRPGEEAPYARKVLVNAFIDQTRRSWWQRERATSHPPESALHHAVTTADEDVARALRELPPRMRAIVVLRYWFDLDPATIARQLGCTSGTVRSQCARALAKLRVDLREPAPVEGEAS
jgi:RNA polymerase sigma-70 factor (sigma-E family)